MNNVTWAVQTNLINDIALHKIWYAVQEAGAKVQELVVIPFSYEFDNDVPEMEGVIIPYGSTKLTKMALVRKWQGLCFDPETFRADCWNKNHSQMLNVDVKFMKVKDIFTEYENADDEKEMFIRPLRDLKEFNGTVTTIKEIKKWMNSVYSGNFSFNEDTDVMIGPVQKLYNECRYFIVDGKVVDGSIYLQNGLLRSLRIDDNVLISKVQKLADEWLPHKTCVMDVALTDDGHKVIEYNCINGTGLYDNDVNKIVREMTQWASKL